MRLQSDFLHNAGRADRPQKGNLRMYSYSSVSSGIAARLRELDHLRQIHTQDSANMIAEFLVNAAEIESLVQERTGLRGEGLRVLDVGCGQQLKLAQYFAMRQNDVTGIDYNVVPQGFDIPGYVQLARSNGPVRVTKTLARKFLGVDTRFSRELRRALRNPNPRPIATHQMDAERMAFADATFDFVYSRSVFEHLENPDRALKEIRRVLKPGGAAHIGAHLYTCDTGAHDPRVLSGRRAQVPMWAHMRPAHADVVQPNAYLNRFRLQAWRDVFAKYFPGAYLHLHQRGRAEQIPLLAELRAIGELSEYSDDELLTDEVVAVWRKGEGN
jgi:ubiquinone/menaquinone biosynthesis C-methylase UbiE